MVYGSATITITDDDPSNQLKIYNDYGYYILDLSSRTFAAANSFSFSLGGKLAEFESVAESQALWSDINSKLSQLESSFNQTTASDGGGAAYLWLGGSDGDTVSTQTSSSWNWKWLSSSAEISKTRPEWGSGSFGDEPDDYRGLQHRLALGLQSWPVSSPGGYGLAGQWNDLKEDNQLWSVVEMPQTITITTNKKSVAEGKSFNTELISSGYGEGREFWWTLSGNGINGSDITVDKITGSSKTDNAGKISLEFTLTQNLDSVPNEKLDLKFFSDSTTTKQLGSTQTINIKDTLSSQLIKIIQGILMTINF